MCGRIIIKKSIKLVAEQLNIPSTETIEEFRGYNIGPGQKAPVLTANKKFEMMTFGLTPHWSKKQLYLFNARSEGDNNKENLTGFTGNKGILQKPSFRSAIRHTRALVFVNGFLEGPENEKLSKPHLVFDESKDFFALAAIWSAWVNKDTGEEVKGFAIITAASNKVTTKIGHHRSPVIIDEEHYDLWLHSEHLTDITNLLEPYGKDTLNAVPVSPDIKNPRVNEPDLLTPIGDAVIPRVGVEFKTEFDTLGFGRKKKL
jgi:putative SOS response-associated peptidase YedK